jgi:hypothetical protein
MISVAWVAAKYDKNPSGDAWIDPETLQGCNDPISSERSAEPRHASIRVIAIGGGRDHQVEIRNGAVEAVVKLLVRGVNLTIFAPGHLQGMLRFCGRDVKG